MLGGRLCNLYHKPVYQCFVYPQNIAKHVLILEKLFFNTILQQLSNSSDFVIFNNLSLQFAIKLFLIIVKGVQPDQKMKDLSDVLVHSTISDFVNNLIKFEGVVKNVWHHELISSFRINQSSSPRWRYSIGLAFRIDWQSTSSTTYGSSFFERHGENALFFLF